MAEDLLINIDVNTKKGKRGVDDLTKSLKANTKQTIAIQKELKKLEKDYKSIATAAKKLPTKDLEKLDKTTRKMTKATQQLGKQFDKTSKKVSVVKDRISDTEVAMAGLMSVLIGFGTLDAPLRFANRVVLGANALDNLINKTGPALSTIKHLMSAGFTRLDQSVLHLTKTYQLFIPAMKEQMAVMKGMHGPTIRMTQFMEQLNLSIKRVGSTASFFQRSMHDVLEVVGRSRERLTRILSVFKILRDSILGTVKTVQNFHQAWFGTFGSSSAGAAQVNKFQQSINFLHARMEDLNKFMRKGLNDTLQAANKGIRSLGVAAVKTAKDVTAKLVPAFQKLLLTGLDLSKLFDTKLAQGLAAMLKATVKVGAKAVSTAIHMGFMKGSIIGLIEVTGTMGISLFALGSYLSSSENSVISFTGSLIQMAGVLSLSVSAGLTLAIAALGAFSIAVGDKLLSVMDEWEKAFVKAETVTRAFTFVIKGFGKAVGEEATGSLTFWNEQIAEMVEATAFGVTSIQKSIKILIAEGSALGLTAEQNAKVLKVSGDIAAATGRKLSEVALGVAKALGGNGAAVESLGLFTDEATLSHSKYAHQLGTSIKALDKHEKAILVMNSIFEQSIPLVGAAADQLNTIAGSQKQLAQATKDLTAKLGSQSSLFASITQVQTRFIQMLSNLPSIVHDAVSAFVDFGGIGLKVLGIFLSFVVTLATVKAAIVGVNLAIQHLNFLQFGMNAILGIAAKKLDIIVPVVTDLKTALIALTQVGLAGAADAFKKMVVSTILATKSAIAYVAQLLFTQAGLVGMATKINIAAASVVRLNVAMGVMAAKNFKLFIAALLSGATALKTFTVSTFFTVAGLKGLVVGFTAVTASIVRFTFALLSNPLFLKAAFIIGSITLLAKAFRELSKELKQLQPQMDKTGASAKANAGFFKQLGDIARNVFGRIVGLAKMVVIGLMKTVRIVELAIIGWKKLKAWITDSTEEIVKLTEEGDKVIEQLVELEIVGESAWATVTEGISSTATAAEATVAQLVHVNEKGREMQSIFSKRLDMSQSTVSINALGTEFEKANQAIVNARFELKAVKSEAFKAIEKVAGVDIAKSFSKSADSFNGFIKRAKVAKEVSEELHKVATKFASASLKVSQAEYNAIAKRDAAIAQAATINSDARKAQLAAQGRVIAKIRVETAEKLKDLDTIRKGIDLLGKSVAVRRSHTAEINKAKAAIIAQSKVAIAAARADQTKKATAALLKKAKLADAFADKEAANLDRANAKLERQARILGSLQKQVGKLNLANLAGSGQTVKLANAEYAIQLAQLDVLEQRLAASGLLTEANKAILEASKTAGAEQLKVKIDEASLLNQFDKVFSNLKPRNFGGEVIKGLFQSFTKAGLQLREAFRVGEEVFQGVDLSVGFMDNMSVIGSNLKEIGKDMFTQKNLVSAGKSMASGIMAVGDFIGDMFSPETISGLADTIDNMLTELPDALLKAFDKLMGSMDKFIDQFVEAFSKLLDKLPEIIDGIIAMIPKFISALVDGLGKLLDMLPGLIMQILDALPAIFAQLLESMPTIIMKIFSALGKIIAGIISIIPDLLINLLEALPDIIGAIIEGLIDAMGSIVAALIDVAMSGGLEKIALAFAKLVPMIVIAIIKGVINGLKKALNNILGGVEFPTSKLQEAGAAISEGFKSGLDKITGEASKLFSVKDFGEAGAALDPAKQAEKIAKKIRESFTIGANLLSRAWAKVMKFWKGFVKLVKRAWDAIIAFFENFAEVIKGAWEFIIDFFEAFGDLIGDAWHGVLHLFETLGEIVQEAFAVVINLFTTLGSIVHSAFDFVFAGFKKFMGFIKDTFGPILESVFKVFTDTAMVFVNFFKDSWSTLVSSAWDPIVSFFKDTFGGLTTAAFDPIIDTFNGLKELVTDAFAATQDFFKSIFKGNIKEAFQGAIDFFQDSFSKIVELAWDKPIAALKNMGSKIWESLKAGLDTAGSIFTDFGTKMWEGLKSSLSGLGDIFKEAFNSLNPSNLLSKLFSTSGDSGAKGPVEKLIGVNVPFVKFARGGEIPGLAGIPGDSLKNDTVPILASPGEFIVPRSIAQDPQIAKLLETLVSGNMPQFGYGGSIGRAISKAYKDSTGGGGGDVSVESVTKDVTGLVDTLDPKKEIMKHIKSSLLKMIESSASILRGKTGGLVGGFSSEDGTQSLLQPGEFVVNRTGVQGLGLNILEQANLGKSTAGNTFNIEVAMEIETTEPVDEQFMRTRVIPAVKDELKQASLRGDFLISSRGIRS